MQVNSILNRVHPVKGFTYERLELVDDESEPNGWRIDVRMRPRRGSRGVSSCCGVKGPTYDHLGPRRFQFVPLLGIAVFLVYRMRRINCPRCGKIQVEEVAWTRGKRPVTAAFECFLARWGKRLSWKEVSTVFWVSWECVYRSSVKSLLRFFRMLGSRASTIRYVCSDMWKPYLKVIRKKLPHAMHILDRYHIVANLNKALDKIRASEARRLKAEGYVQHLHKTRWCFLKRKPKLTDQERIRLRDVLQYDLRTVRAYLKIQAFQLFWEYTSPTWAGKFLDAWCGDVMRSGLEPLKQVTRSLRAHRGLILNWFEAKKQYNAGIVEGLNAIAKLSIRKARGFRTLEAMKVALYHQLGQLPEPPSTHIFC